MGKQVPEKAMNELLRSIPLGRLGDPMDFAKTVVSLVDNNYMTGTVVRLDGGLRLGYLWCLFGIYCIKNFLFIQIFVYFLFFFKILNYDLNPLFSNFMFKLENFILFKFEIGFLNNFY